MRELTVDWVMWSRSAAPTKLPAATTSRKVRARSIMITHSSYRSSRYEPRRFVVCQTTHPDLGHGCLFGLESRRPARATPRGSPSAPGSGAGIGARAGRSFADAADMAAISRVRPERHPAAPPRVLCKDMAMAIDLPDLPYPYQALEPHIS